MILDDGYDYYPDCDPGQAPSRIRLNVFHE
jgi:hypothetical protein